MIYIGKKLNISRDYLYQNYSVEKKTAIQIAEELGIHPSTVARYIHRYNIKTNSKEMRFTTEDEQRIIDCYLLYNNLSMVSKRLEISKDIIKRILKKHNIQIVKHPILKQYNTNFFSEYTPQTCYWAGFIAADGNIHNVHNRLTIDISNTDVEHLTKFVHQIEYEGDIHFKEASYSHGATCRIDLGGERIVKDLKNYFGIMPNKTLTVSMPESIPYQFWSHYFRGYADGDGCISFSGGVPHFTVVSGSIIMINQWLDYLYNEGIRIKNKSGKPSIITQGRCKSIHYYKLNAKRVLDIIYKDSYNDIRLDRKYNKYLEVVKLSK